MNSIQSLLNMPLTEDMLVSDPNQIYSSMGLSDDPRTISRKIQETLGAKNPNESGIVGDILSQRFQPSLDDVSKGAVNTLLSGRPVSGEDVSNSRIYESLDRLNSLARIQSYGRSGGTSVFSQTLEAINSDPELKDLPMIQKIRMAQNKLGTNLTVGPDGKVVEMTGAPDALGKLSFGDKAGEQAAIAQYAREIARLKGMGEADTASLIAQMTAEGKAKGGATGANLTREVNAPQILGYVSEAEKLLPQATGSLGGRISKFGTQQLGISTNASQADKRLAVIAAALTANVPRMEGPQSDYDVALYQQAAGDVANTNIPYQDRLAALQTIKTLQNKYLNKTQTPSGGVVHFNDLPD